MKAGVVVFPGSNCDHDCYHVMKHVLEVDTTFLWHKDTDLKGADFILLPGGFSYGDYLRCGAIAKFSPIMEQVIEFAEKGGLVMGICNGFQVLTESGLLPGALIRNRDLKFICKYTNLRVETNNAPFLSEYSAGEIISVPIAHMEGNYTIDDEGYALLEKNGQIAFRYSDESGNVDDSTNPNGARGNIAGILNAKGNVLGMMPHPERCAEDIMLTNDGVHIFRAVKKYLKGAL